MNSMAKKTMKKNFIIEKPTVFFNSNKPVKTKIIKGDCFTAMDQMITEGLKFDMIFADPPYFLSNGGITCQSGRMVKVDKGEWDESQGPELNHEFNTEWIKRCRDLLADHGTLWVSGTMHVIYSVGFAMQQLEMKILNNVTWQKPNPPPHLAGRYFTHSTETILWARKNEKAKHKFNYSLMKEDNGGKQMKDVWTFTAPGKAEKSEGKHPTQKPLVLLDRIIKASTDIGGTILDPFLGSGTTCVAALLSSRNSVGIEQEEEYCELSKKRIQWAQKELKKPKQELLNF
jgi:site-specific DNA-methyltransferase (adenine-specific)